MRRVMGLLTVLWVSALFAGMPDFSGKWTVDLRNTEDKRRGFACGEATFDLQQTGDRILGSHSFYPLDCGQINEGGEETVKGTVVGNVAVLVVTSGRNGAIVLGRARLEAGQLRWEMLEDVRPGEPSGDSPLILRRGDFHRVP